jgi:hypothetical protein
MPHLTALPKAGSGSNCRFLTTGISGKWQKPVVFSKIG